MRSILQLLSVLVLALFASIWIWIGIKLLSFHPSRQTPVLTFTEPQVTVAGFLASAVGAGTASILGIEIQKVNGQNTLVAQVNQAATNSGLLTFGILLYAAVGIFVLMVWVFSSNASPDMVGAFSLGVLGWLGGALAAVFRKTA